MQIKVVDVRKPVPNHQLIYCGRAMPGRDGSVLGNPFKLSGGEERGATIQRYRRWLWACLQDEGSPQYKELARIAALVKAGVPVQLACWCAPKPCHCDVLRSAVLWMMERL